jgi:hypothetical protein
MPAERFAARTEPVAVRDVVQRRAEAPEVPAAIAAVTKDHAVLVRWAERCLVMVRP